MMLIAKKVYHVDQDLYILSAAIGKVLFERKPLGELFGKPKHPQNDSDNGQLTLWEKFFGRYVDAENQREQRYKITPHKVSKLVIILPFLPFLTNL